MEALYLFQPYLAMGLSFSNGGSTYWWSIFQTTQFSRKWVTNHSKTGFWLFWVPSRVWCRRGRSIRRTGTSSFRWHSPCLCRTSSDIFALCRPRLEKYVKNTYNTHLWVMLSSKHPGSFFVRFGKNSIFSKAQKLDFCQKLDSKSQKTRF